MSNTVRDLRGAQPLVDVLGIGRYVTAELRFAHERGQVHGQLAGRWVDLVEDYAVVRFPPPRPRRGLTRTALAVGNVAWVLAPEQLSDARPPFDPAVDLYALGVILYELASGRTIYRPRLETVQDAIRAKVEGDLVPLRERDPSLPAWFTGFVDDLLALDPARRPRADEAHRLLLREHETALLARHRPRRRTPPPAVPEALSALYEVLTPIGPSGRSGELWEYLVRPRAGGALAVLHLSRADDLVAVAPFHEGETLAARLARLGPLPTPELAALGRALAASLGALHTREVHGCLTPERVRVDFDGRFHLTSAFPLGRRHPATEVDALELSPEHLARDVVEAVEPASDRYGLGLVLYAAATGGELPYPGGDRLARLRSKRDGRRVPLRKRARVSRRLARLVDRLLDPSPARRPSLTQVAATLARC